MHQLHSLRLAFLVALGLTIAASASPLLGLPGVESALLFGLVLPPFAGLISARALIARRLEGAARGLWELLAPTQLAALGLVALATAGLSLNALRFRLCEPLLGLAFLGMGPALGVSLASLLGLGLAATIPRPRIASALAFGLPLLSLLAGLLEFWLTPGISLFGHFAGWFPGTIYDEGVTFPIAYLTYRLTSLGLGLVALLLLGAAWDPARLEARPGALLRRPLRLLAPLLGLLALGFAWIEAPALGHRSSATHIASELGATFQGERCRVHLPREMPLRQAHRLLEDCDFRVTQAERGLGVRESRLVEAYFYRSADEKRALMGAGRTFLAKPWRAEVHLQLAGWPHPVLGHEIAHVVAANAAPGPFRVVGSFGGWLPDPGLVEGVAVALAWEPREGLTPHQWARAMLEIDRLPPIGELVGLSFLRQPAANAYTGAGSLLRFLSQTEGEALLREVYASGDLEAATGQPLEELERRWHAFLGGVELPARARGLARMRFERPSLFSAICPHATARLRAALGGDLPSGDFARVRAGCDELLRIDPADLGSRSQLIGALSWLGELEAAERELHTLEDSHGAPAPYRVAARRRRADALWARGEQAAALEQLLALRDLPQLEADARALEVRILGLEAGGEQEALIFELLVGETGL
ncbi:MAG: hypothetical protein OEY14_13535, partial [Myxococcales bacterium]|nr:hypothetical protein [Myxococcales bacterium]